MTSPPCWPATTPGKSADAPPHGSDTVSEGRCLTDGGQENADAFHRSSSSARPLESGRTKTYDARFNTEGEGSSGACGRAAGRRRPGPEAPGGSASSAAAYVREPGHAARRQSGSRYPVRRRRGPSAIAPSFAPARRFKDIWPEFSRARIGPDLAKATALGRELADAPHDVDDLLNHGIDLVSWLERNGESARAAAVLRDVRSAWMIQFVSIGGTLPSRGVLHGPMLIRRPWSPSARRRPGPGGMTRRSVSSGWPARSFPTMRSRRAPGEW